jgi:nucleotide-binding universal stress UspA family protein
MTIKTVLLHAAAETCDPGRSAAAYALGLAGAFEAHLEALVLELDVVSPKSVYGRQIAAEARVQVHERNQQAGAVAGALRAAARAHGIDALVVTDRSHIHSTPEIAADRARIVDIVVAGVCDVGLLSERLVAEALVFESGRPVIIVPTDYHDSFQAERVVVAWDFSRVAARALAEAIPILHRAKDVTLVSFGDDKAFSSSINQNDVLAALARRGVQATFAHAERGSRNIGDAINAEALERRADLLVMGGYGHSRLRDFVLGGATQGILKAPAVPTLISH